MSVEDNKKLVRRWLEGVDTANPGVIDDFLTPGFTDHNPPPFPGASPTIEGARNAFTYALTAFTDFSHSVDEQWGEGDTVISRITGRGKHTGEFLGVPPSGNEVVMEGIAVHRVVDGKIVEHRAQIDALGLLIQMGAVPPPGAPPA